MGDSVTTEGSDAGATGTVDCRTVDGFRLVRQPDCDLAAQWAGLFGDWMYAGPERCGRGWQRLLDGWFGSTLEESPPGGDRRAGYYGLCLRAALAGLAEPAAWAALSPTTRYWVAALRRVAVGVAGPVPLALLRTAQGADTGFMEEDAWGEADMLTRRVRMTATAICKIAVGQPDPCLPGFWHAHPLLDNALTHHFRLASALGCDAPDDGQYNALCARLHAILLDAAGVDAGRLAAADAVPWPAGPPLDAAVYAWGGGRIYPWAVGVWDARAWESLPILADALEDAGVADRHLLAHLRLPPAVHGAGCWALARVLGECPDTVRRAHPAWEEPLARITRGDA